MYVDCVHAAGQTLPGLPDQPELPWRELGLAMALCNDAVAGRDGELKGDPTETALLAAAQAAGVDKEKAQQTLPRLAEIPFDAERARMSTLHRDGDNVLMFVKGAPERVLALCTDRLDAGGAVAVFDAAALQETAEALAAQGLRVLAFALKRLPQVPELVEGGIMHEGLHSTLLGLRGMPAAAEAIMVGRDIALAELSVTLLILHRF